ncbi:MAG TPA: hypothetical protein VN937_24295 [Blastocatellia bacterium]|nr:hypothetical protein [Blastocatellia bacterium]
MKIKSKPNALTKKSRRGFRGYPVATVAFYGPDDKRATKVAVGIINEERADPDPLQRWHSDQTDLRFDEQIIKQVLDFIRRHKALSVATTDRIIGCPHEEGIDYPEGTSCPECPFWEGRNRWTGEIEKDSKLIH